MSHQIDTGANHPLGAALAGGRANFSLFSRPATRVESLFFDRADDANPSRVVDLDIAAHRTYHYWHAYEAMISGPTLWLSRSWVSKRVRCGVIVVESKDGIPVEIVKSQYPYILFDSNGWLLMEWDEKEARLAMDMLEPVIADKDKQVVDARYKFVRSDAPGSICGNCLLKSRQLSGR